MCGVCGGRGSSEIAGVLPVRTDMHRLSCMSVVDLEFHRRFTHRDTLVELRVHRQIWKKKAAGQD